MNNCLRGGARYPQGLWQLDWELSRSSQARQLQSINTQHKIYARLFLKKLAYSKENLDESLSYCLP